MRTTWWGNRRLSSVTVELKTNYSLGHPRRCVCAQEETEDSRCSSTVLFCSTYSISVSEVVPTFCFSRGDQTLRSAKYVQLCIYGGKLPWTCLTGLLGVMSQGLLTKPCKLSIRVNMVLHDAWYPVQSD